MFMFWTNGLKYPWLVIIEKNNDYFESEFAVCIDPLGPLYGKSLF